MSKAIHNKLDNNVRIEAAEMPQKAKHIRELEEKIQEIIEKRQKNSKGNQTKTEDNLVDSSTEGADKVNTPDSEQMPVEVALVPSSNYDAESESLTLVQSAAESSFSGLPFNIPQPLMAGAGLAAIGAIGVGLWATSDDGDSDGNNTSQSTTPKPTAPSDSNKPIFLTPSSATVNENSTGSIYQVLVSDESALTYSVSGTDAGKFGITSDGKLTLATGETLDYETQQSYIVTLTATDAAGNSSSQNFTLSLDDVNEAPVAAAIPSVTAPNGSSFSTSIAAYFTDVDAGDTITYSATGLPSGLTISSNGTISGTATTDGSYSVTITGTDGSGLTASQTTNVLVGNSLALASQLDGVTNLDVRSDLVLTANENLSLTTTVGTYYITIEDLSTSSGYGLDATSPQNNTMRLEIKVNSNGTSTLSWYENQAAFTNNIKTTVSDPDDFVVFDGNTVRLSLVDHLDLSSNYKVTVDNGLLVGSSTGTSTGYSASFSTVQPTSNGGDSTNAATSVKMNADGSLSNSSSWLDLTDVGNGFQSTAQTTDASSGAIVYVLQDADSKSASALDDGIKVNGDANVSIQNFGLDDLLYIDNIFNSSQNDMTISTFGSGNGSSSQPFNWTQVTENAVASIAIVNIELDSSLGTVSNGALSNVVSVLGFQNGMVISA
jgi:hypothetical protein